MYHLLRLEFTLKIITQEDVIGDEPKIEVAFLRIINNRASVQIRDSGVLAEDFPNPLGVASGSNELRNKVVETSYDPDTDGTYIGIVVRAIEEDSSSGETRRANQESFAARIEDAAQQAIDSGHTPTVDEIWVAGNSVTLLDSDLVDDDDRIGVSARVYKDAGKTIADNDGSFNEDLELRFREEGAHYLLTGQLRAIPNPIS